MEAQKQMNSAFRLVAVGAVTSLLFGCGGGLGQALFGSDSSSSPAATAGQPSSSTTPTPPPTTVAQTVVVTVGGAGSVTSSPAGINCTATSGCAQSFPAGTSLTLVASPSQGQAFVGWTGDCSGSAPTCVITVNATANVGAQFAPAVQLEALQVTVGGAGTVASSPTGLSCSATAGNCTQSFDSGTTVTLTATAASGNAFVGWTGACSGSARTCTITLTSAQSVGASFAAIVQTDSLNVTVGGSGTVKSSPAGINCSAGAACSQSFANGTQVTLTAAAASGNTFSGWTGACSGSAATCVVTMSSASQSVGATFAVLTQYDALQVAVGGSGSVSSSPAGISCGAGSSVCSHSFVNGTAVTLTATAASGYAFSGWSGACSGSAPSCRLTLNAASQSVGASFAATIQYFALQVASNGNGSVTSNPAGISCNGTTGCSQSFASGTSVTLTATPAAGYVFSGWSGACGGSSPSCTVTMSSAQNVGATFAASAPPTVARYLVSDPYPLTGLQPSLFLVACDGAAAVNSAPAVNADGTSYLYFSLAGLASGAHTCTIVATDTANQQSPSVSVSFTI
jgi:uncharacterized repeat protein (TIGR02543 family)